MDHERPRRDDDRKSVGERTPRTPKRKRRNARETNNLRHSSQVPNIKNSFEDLVRAISSTIKSKGPLIGLKDLEEKPVRDHNIKHVGPQ